MFVSENKSTVEKHNENGHAKRIKCHRCDEYFKNETSLKEHTDSIHTIPEPFPCKFCGSVLANYDVMQNHIKIIHTPPSIRCQYWESTTDDKEILQTHMVETDEEFVVLYTMAKQVDGFCDSFDGFETFIKEVAVSLKLY